MSAEYVPIRVSTLRGDQKIDFDAYVKINDKFILYIRTGDSFEGERLQRLKAKKLKKMFIAPTSEQNYRTYMQKNIEMAYDKGSGKDLTTRAEIIQGNQQANAELVMEDPGNAQAYQDTKDAAGKFVQFLEQEDKSLSAILNIKNADQNIAHHGVTVSSLSVTLAKKMKIQDPRQLQLLSLGALLHDFEHFSSGLAINRPVDQLNEAELQTYKQHPIVGAQKVQDKKHFDASVIKIIAEHEEFIDGKGYPNGLVESKMDPLSLLVAPCNMVDRLVTFEGVHRKEAVRQLMITAVGRYPLNYIQALGDIMSTVESQT
jgi:putative nucleotidyltransferase with HDIG domain